MRMKNCVTSSLAFVLVNVIKISKYCLLSSEQYLDEQYLDEPYLDEQYLDESFILRINET